MNSLTTVRVLKCQSNWFKILGDNFQMHKGQLGTHWELATELLFLSTKMCPSKLLTYDPFYLRNQCGLLKYVCGINCCSLAQSYARWFVVSEYYREYYCCKNIGLNSVRLLYAQHWKWSLKTRVTGARLLVVWWSILLNTSLTKPQTFPSPQPPKLRHQIIFLMF